MNGEQALVIALMLYFLLKREKATRVSEDSFSEDKFQIVDMTRDEISRLRKRDVSTVDTIVIHQTGTEFDVTSNQIKIAGGDKHKALHNRAKKINAHAVVFNEHGVDCNHGILIHPLSGWEWMSHGFSKRSINLEIEGDYPLKMDRPQMSQEFIQAVRLTLKWLLDEARSQGMPIKYIVAHRQANDSRARDPGEEIWREVVLDYAVPVLGLQIRPDYTVGSGRTIPDYWGRE